MKTYSISIELASQHDDKLKVLLFPNAEQAVARAAGLVIYQVKSKPASVLGLATDGTVLDVYCKLVEASQQGPVCQPHSEPTRFELTYFSGCITET